MARKAIDTVANNGLLWLATWERLSSFRTNAGVCWRVLRVGSECCACWACWACCVLPVMVLARVGLFASWACWSWCMLARVACRCVHMDLRPKPNPPAGGGVAGVHMLFALQLVVVYVGVYVYT